MLLFKITFMVSEIQRPVLFMRVLHILKSSSGIKIKIIHKNEGGDYFNYPISSSWKLRSFPAKTY